MIKPTYSRKCLCANCTWLSRTNAENELCVGRKVVAESRDGISSHPLNGAGPHAVFLWSLTVCTVALVAYARPIPRRFFFMAVDVVNPYEMAVAQFDQAAERLGLSQPMRAILRKPKRELIVNFPLRMDNGDVELVTGYR